MATRVEVATIDSHMNSVDPSKDTNYGTFENVELGIIVLGGDKAKNMRAISNFDVSFLAGLTINSAELQRRLGGVSDGVNSWGAKIFRCTRPATWTEGGVTWNKYDGVNNWTTPGGDLDNTTPAPVAYTEPASPPSLQIVTGMKDFVTDAIANRNNIVSLIIRADDEDPPNTDWIAWRSAQFGIVFSVWRLVIAYVELPPPGHGFGTVVG